MFITYGEGNLLDAHVRLRKQLSGAVHSLFNEQMTQAYTRAIFEQMLQVGLAQVALQGQIMDLARRRRFNHLQDPANATLLHRRSDRTHLDLVDSDRSIAGVGALLFAIRRRGIGPAFRSAGMNFTHEKTPHHDPG